MANETPDLQAYFGNGLSLVRGALGSVAVSANFRLLVCYVTLPHRATLTGVTYCVGSAAGGNAKSALWNTANSRLANCTATLAQSTPGANSPHQLPFDATYLADPGVYAISVIFSSNTGTFQGGMFGAPSRGQTEASHVNPSTLGGTPTVSSNTVPIMSLY